ncbi:MAG: hypothetical protein P8J86_11305 [Phycisphaerales bacterium]|nr:hypothetical protein [Phycisphaerales bacterium]
MSRFGSDYQVTPPTGHCAKTGIELLPGHACMASLCDDPEGGGFRRLDYSLEIWAEGYRPDGLFGFWRTTIPTAQENHRPFVDDEVLMEIFEQLSDDSAEQRVAFRFVLALILIRKRLLRFDGRTESDAEGNEVWLLKRRGQDTGGFEIVNPQLTDDDVQALTDQLGQVLRGDLQA